MACGLRFSPDPWEPTITLLPTAIIKNYRRAILADGAELYEFKHNPSRAIREISNVPPVEAEFICLHVKAMVGDRQRCFIGSLNLLTPERLKSIPRTAFILNRRGSAGSWRSNSIS